MSYFNRYLLGGFVPTSYNTTGSFTPTIYTGTGAARSIQGLGYRPDLVWIKDRDDGSIHIISDIVRGSNFYVSSNNNLAQQTSTSVITSFDLDGFSLGNSADVNQSGADNISWTWKAGSDNATTISANEFWKNGTNYASAASAGIGGTATITGASVNTVTGFSIINYTGDGNLATTVGHGLADAEWIIVKDLDGTNAGTGFSNWRVWHKDLTANTWLYLNLTNSEAVSAIDGGLKNGTSSTFGFINGISNIDSVNRSGNNYIAYIWDSVAGESSFGTYAGNNGTNNITGFGFQPDFLMVKNITSNSDWGIFDSARNTSDPRNLLQVANTAGIDVTPLTAFPQSFDADGFTVTSNSNSINASGQNYIYSAFKKFETTARNIIAGAEGIAVAASANMGAGMDWFLISSATLYAGNTPSTATHKGVHHNGTAWVVYHTDATNAYISSSPDGYNWTYQGAFAIGGGLVENIRWNGTYWVVAGQSGNATTTDPTGASGWTFSNILRGWSDIEWDGTQWSGGTFNSIQYAPPGADPNNGAMTTWVSYQIATGLGFNATTGTYILCSRTDATQHLVQRATSIGGALTTIQSIAGTSGQFTYGVAVSDNAFVIGQGNGEYTTNTTGTSTVTRRSNLGANRRVYGKNWDGTSYTICSNATVSYMVGQPADSANAFIDITSDLTAAGLTGNYFGVASADGVKNPTTGF